MTHRDYFGGRERIEIFEPSGRPMRMGEPAELAVSNDDRVLQALAAGDHRRAAEYVALQYESNATMIAIYVQWPCAYLLAAFLLAHIRDHFSGPERKGAATLREYDDRCELIFDPCGSGGAMRRRLGSAQARLPAASPATFGRAGEVPPYCTHCAINARTAIARFGWPIYITRFNPDPAKPCGWTIYKTPDDIPEQYFEALGHARDAGRFRRGYWVDQGDTLPTGWHRPNE